MNDGVGDVGFMHNGTEELHGLKKDGQTAVPALKLASLAKQILQDGPLGVCSGSNADLSPNFIRKMNCILN